ncbi:winged helix-turn-helix domain-containing protein [Intestinibacter bartlettii]|uniref:Stage 0 sporulation protein A homolog n=1 Tax=Intestinibacter bartlettii CAG:1329 TaxID=1263063 RepID=R5XNI5_9FIRM|nr:response regulator transcription factor [Intestinibacter bartlettii]CDA10341.1 response regulator receiver domain protein [Intestinibacter bartlettii CAG:1329]
MKKILIIDDEIHIVELLKFNLENNGYKVDYSYDGFDGYLKTKEFQPDLILLDWMLPNISGIDLLKKIRSDETLEQIPVIMLTAKNMEEDKLEGLEDGADDYITKPFSVREVLARITSVLRRYKYTSNEKIEVLKADDIQVNVNKHIVTKNGQEIELTLKEFQILKLLIENKGNVLTRTFLLDKIWGYDYYGETRTLDVHIRHLRKKIGDNDSKLIETVRGVGYKIK